MLEIFHFHTTMTTPLPPPPPSMDRSKLKEELGEWQKRETVSKPVNLKTFGSAVKLINREEGP